MLLVTMTFIPIANSMVSGKSLRFRRLSWKPGAPQPHHAPLPAPSDPLPGYQIRLRELQNRAAELQKGEEEKARSRWYYPP